MKTLSRLRNGKEAVHCLFASAAFQTASGRFARKTLRSLEIPFLRHFQRALAGLEGNQAVLSMSTAGETTQGRGARIEKLFPNFRSAFLLFYHSSRESNDADSYSAVIYIMIYCHLDLFLKHPVYESPLRHFPFSLVEDDLNLIPPRRTPTRTTLQRIPPTQTQR